MLLEGERLKMYLYILMDVFFLQSSCLQSVSIGWDGGVYVQTCGHTLHIDCHKSYMESLRVRTSLTLVTLGILLMFEFRFHRSPFFFFFFFFSLPERPGPAGFFC